MQELMNFAPTKLAKHYLDSTGAQMHAKVWSKNPSVSEYVKICQIRDDICQ